MFKKNFALVLMTVAALGVSACKEKTASTEVTDKSVVDGTTTETTTKSETSVDSEGNATRETTTKTTIDPEGAMNKTTTEETHTEESTPPQ